MESGIELRSCYEQPGNRDGLSLTARSRWIKQMCCNVATLLSQDPIAPGSGSWVRDSTQQHANVQVGMKLLD